MTNIPFGSASITSPPTIVLRLEFVTLCPCAFRPEADVWFNRLFSAFPADSLPKSAEICELAFDAREFFTVPSVDAARLSETTMAIGSCTRDAFTSEERRARRPSGVQIAPGER